ncbi:CLUMA_CG019569, isoform A [Clunio marinus]|uniref:CLUMA_CG019569, isoform A n=1 Tax=Clunio marinus TaxID=568069 RepID=A0A1J1J1J7_9DIPT|nr:CLUMA_CG019569, isoform A [Clunio marinus]
MIKILFVASLMIVAYAQNFECPTETGLYPDDIQCDKYYECNGGIAKEHLCADGLVFDVNIKRISKCDQPFNVDCGDRTELQPPRGTNEYCPRKNGIFAHPDETICDIFYSCVDGEYIETKCVGGLHFDEYSGTCVWPEVANRENCQEHKKKLKDGFVCPKDGRKNDASGQVIAHPHYAHSEDCQKFYVCLNGIEPRELRCEDGESFNDETKRCDSSDNVPGCEEVFLERK